MIRARTALDQDALKCRVCSETKPVSEFYFAKVRGRFDTKCKECCRKYAKKYAAGMSDEERYNTRKNARLKRKFGITLAVYNFLFNEQGGLCAICKNPETTIDWYGPRSLAVDHDHSTGKIRGLLCYKCNVGLGHFKEDVSRIKSAIRYIVSGAYIFLAPVWEKRKKGTKTLATSPFDWRMRYEYGINEFEYNSMVEMQGGRCAICYLPPGAPMNTFDLDHCHKTGNVRGLLCRGCNTGIGFMAEDTDRLGAAINYLEREKA